MAGPERDETRQLLKHWKNFRGGKRLPNLEDIRMDLLTPFAPHLFVLEIESESRFIIKQVGQAILERFGGIDPRGINFLDVTEPVFRERLRARVSLIFEFGYAACTHVHVLSMDGQKKRTENLLLPVENTAGGFRLVYGTIYYTPGQDENAQHATTLDGLKAVDESFIDLGSGYAATIDASELPYSIFPSNPNQGS